MDMKAVCFVILIAASTAFPLDEIVSSYVGHDGASYQIVKNCASDAFGGNEGADFDDAEAAGNGLITKGLVRHASRIDMLQFRYGDIWGDYHGGSGGGLSSFEVPVGHDIIKVDGRHGSKIDSIKFTFSNSQSTPAYGGEGGTAFTATQCPTCPLLYISGKSDSEVRRLVFTFRCQ